MVTRFKLVLVVVAVGIVLAVGVFVLSPNRSGGGAPPLLSDRTLLDSSDAPGDNEPVHEHIGPVQSPQQAGAESTTDGPSAFVEARSDEFDQFLNHVVESAEDQSIQIAMQDPRALVKMRFVGTPYHRLAQSFDSTSLPKFYEVLRDSNSSGYELDQAVIFIGQISDRGNQEAADALLEFARQGVNWDKWKWQDDKLQASTLVISKWHALSWLGYIGGDNAEEVLIRAMTPDGAKALAKEWLGGVPVSAFSQDAVVGNLRGYAAKGLAYSDKPAIHELIKSEYERERQACIDAGVIAANYFNQLCDAMARMDVVKEIGVEAHRALYDGMGSYSNLYQRHIRKYLLFKAVEPSKKAP